MGKRKDMMRLREEEIEKERGRNIIYNFKKSVTFFIF